MSMTRAGGIAAAVCAATYLIGFALLVTLLAPLGFGTADIDPAAVAAFIHAHPGVMIGWNTTIYIVNALALAVLVVALSERFAPVAPGLSALARGIGLVWVALVLGAGMIANVAVERAAHLYPGDPAAAAEVWSVLHAVELGLGGGNEVAGGAWLACVCLAGRAARRMPRAVWASGLLIGAAGAVTILPPAGEVAGAVFGLGAIAWFLAVARTSLSGRE